MLLCRFVQTTAAVLLAGDAVLRLLAHGTALDEKGRWHRLTWVSWGMLLATSLLQLWLTTAEMNGLPLVEAWSGEALGRIVAATRFGAIWRVRVGLLGGALAVGMCGAAARRWGVQSRVSGTLDWVGAGLAAGLLAALVWSGHAGASAQRAWLLPADVVHAVTAGVWPGGLLPLALLLARPRTKLHLVSSTVVVVRRFSRLSLVAVGVLTASGLLNAYGLVGTFSALWPNRYGRFLLLKVVILITMIGLGAVNRRLARFDASADPAETLRRLWRNVACECLLAAGVLLATEALAMSAPPAASAM